MDEIEEEDELEVIEKKKTDERCDVWSIGVLLYVMISGKAPFDGKSDQDIRSSIKEASGADISFSDPIWREISEDAQKLIKWMLTYDVKKRPTAREVLKDRWF